MKLDQNSLFIAIIIIIICGIIVAFIHNKLLKRKNFGKITGAIIAGIFGAALGAFAFDWILIKIVTILQYTLYAIKWLMKDQNVKILPPINIIAALLGAFVIIYILYKVTPGQYDE